LATILLNGVVTDASTISGSDLNDKLTVSGGVDGLSVDLAEGDDRVEIYADSEDVANAEIRVSAGDDVITVAANDGSFVSGAAEQFVGLPVSLGDSLLGGPGDDTISLTDGLVELTGAVKGNEGDDTIEVGNVKGGTVNGNSGDDTISIGGAVEEAGSRAVNSLTNGSLVGGQGDDTITINADVTDSAVRGNEGDDTITFIGGEVSGATTINGNAGDDAIDSTGAEGDLTVIGGSGNDTLTVGGGQVVRGGKGTDTFIVASEGGAILEDYDNLEGADPAIDCFCDEDIKVDGWQFDVANYDVNTEVYTSASSWTGDIKVKAVAVADGDGDTAVAKLTKTKTETLTAFAVARAFITETVGGKVAATGALATNADYAVNYPGIGKFKTGGTFANGQSGAAFTANNDGNGQAYASAEGLWYARNNLTASAIVKGIVNPVTAKTYTSFEKGDFSFLQLTAKDTIGVAVGQKLLFNDVTNATIKNHWASYTKSKETLTSKTLKEINFGTAAFDTITTGKGFMVITKGLDTAKVYDTKTITEQDAKATATAKLDLDNAFYAWHKVNSDAGAVTKLGDQFTVKYTTKGGITTTVAAADQGKVTGTWKKLTGLRGMPATHIRVNEAGEHSHFAASKVVGRTLNVNTYPSGTGTFKTTTTNIKFNLGTAKGNRSGILLDNNQVMWSTVRSNEEATLTTTAKYATGKFGAAPTGTAPDTRNGYIKVTKTVGVNNTNVTQDDYVTATGKLVMKIQASDIATAKATAAVNTLVERMTIEGAELSITSCPAFPTTGEFGTRIVDGFAKHGEITGDFIKQYVFTSEDVVVTAKTLAGGTKVTAERVNSINNLLTRVNGKGNILTETGTITADGLNNTALGFGQGFFSAPAFTVDTLVKQDFGSRAVVEAGSGAQNVPFRVLFLDNDEADNGLYVVSGLANYKSGDLTGLRTNPTTVGGSTMAGKHTIVKVSGDKGHPIELSDISFI